MLDDLMLKKIYDFIRPPHRLRRLRVAVTDLLNHPDYFRWDLEAALATHVLVLVTIGFPVLSALIAPWSIPGTYDNPLENIYWQLTTPEIWELTARFMLMILAIAIVRRVAAWLLMAVLPTDHWRRSGRRTGS